MCHNRRKVLFLTLNAQFSTRVGGFLPLKLHLLSRVGGILSLVGLFPDPIGVFSFSSLHAAKEEGPRGGPYGFKSKSNVPRLDVARRSQRHGEHGEEKKIKIFSMSSSVLSVARWHISLFPLTLSPCHLVTYFPPARWCLAWRLGSCLERDRSGWSADRASAMVCGLASGRERR